MKTTKLHIKTRYIKAIPGYLVIVLFSLFSLLPFYIMLVMGTYNNADLNTGLKMIPGDYLLGNLKTILKTDYFTYYRNSLLVSCTATLGGLLVCSMAGYAFAKHEFRFKEILFVVVLGTLMIPKQLGLVGFLVEMRTMGMLNTLLPLMVPPMASAFGVFWMRQYIEGAVPDELLESAKLDGCNEFRIYAMIVMPVIRPALVTIFLLLFLWSWNEYLTPLVILNKESLYTVPLGASLLGNMYRADYAARILALSIATLPILVLFSFGSKSLIKGLVAGSVKG